MTDHVLTTLRTIASSQTPTLTLTTECRKWGVHPVTIGDSVMIWTTLQKLAAAMVVQTDRTAPISHEKGA